MNDATGHRLPCLPLLLALLLCLCPLSTRGQDDQPQPERVLYKTTTDAKGNKVELFLHVFKPEGWKAGDQRPAIVCFFGGGWVGGKPDQFYPQCRELAGRGMVAISAEYRIQSKHGTPPQACVEDGKSAIRFVRGNAEALGIDPQRIVGAGGSAGGHVAACTGVISDYEAVAEDKTISSVPNLMVLFNPVIDTSPQTGYGAKKIGDNPLTLSPLHQVHKGQPPSLILHGIADTTVSIDSVRRFEKACKDKDIACRLAAYEGAGHGFFNHSSFRKRKDGDPDYYALTMGEVTRFLAKHGYVKADDE